MAIDPKNGYVKQTKYNGQAADIMGINPDNSVGLISNRNALADELDAFNAEIEATPGVSSARQDVTGKEAALRKLDTEASDITAKTEKQVMVENIVAGLGQVIAGYVAGKEGYDPGEMNIKTSNFGELLAGRLKQLDMKKATASDELSRSERGLREKLDAAANWKRFQMQDTAEKNRMLADAGMRLYLENLESQRRAQDKATRDQEANLGPITALTQNIGTQYRNLQTQQKEVSSLIGELANKDETKVTTAKRELASKFGEDPTAYEALDPAAIELRAQEFYNRLNTKAQTLDILSNKLALKTASKQGFTKQEEEIIPILQTKQALVPSNDIPLGQIKARTFFPSKDEANATDAVLSNASQAVITKLQLGNTALNDQEKKQVAEAVSEAKGFLSIGDMVGLARKDPAFAKSLAALSKAAARKSASVFWDDPEVDVLQEKMQTGEYNKLTINDLKILNSKAGDQLYLALLATPEMTTWFDKQINNSIKSKNYDRLEQLSPGTQIGVKGFGEVADKGK